MIKSIFVGRRAPGRSRAAAHRHLLEVHGPMVVCRPADAGPAPAVYVQNHVVDGAYPEHGDHALERDLVTEFWFPTVEEMQASGQTPYYLANMKPDEPRFVTQASVARMRVEETILRDGERHTAKLFLFASRDPNVDDATWRRGYADVVTMVEAAAGLTALVANTVVFPANDGRFADVVLEAWFVDEAAAAALLDRFDALRAALGDGADPARTLAVIARQVDADRIRAGHESRQAGI